MTPVFYLFFDCVIIFCLDITFFQTISHLTNTVWLTFLRNPIIARDETYTSIFPALLEISKAKLFKVRQSFLTSYNSCKPTRFEVQCLFVAWLWEFSALGRWKLFSVFLCVRDWKYESTFGRRLISVELTHLCIVKWIMIKCCFSVHVEYPLCSYWFKHFSLSFIMI